MIKTGRVRVVMEESEDKEGDGERRRRGEKGKKLRKRRREQASESTLGEARYSQPSTPEKAM